MLRKKEGNASEGKKAERNGQMECQVEKAWETKLRQDAEHLNSSLTAIEKSVKFFKVIGGRRERRIACFPIK